MKQASRVLVLGAPASGKSTFCAELSRRTGLPWVQLDRAIADLADAVQRPVGARDEPWRRHVARAAAEPKWIIDGVWPDTLDERLARAEQVILFDFAPARCLRQALSRAARVVLGLPTHVPRAVLGRAADRWAYATDLNHYRSIARFRRDALPPLRERIARSGASCVELRTPTDARALLAAWSAG